MSEGSPQLQEQEATEDRSLGTVFLAIRQELLRSALQDLILKMMRFSVLAVENAAEVAQAARRVDHLKILVIDVDWQRPEDFEFIRRVKASRCDCPVLVISERQDEALCEKLSRMEIQGCVSKNDSIEILQEALKEIAGGRTYFPAAFVEALRRAKQNLGRATTLTPREEEILVHVANGLTSRSIAEKLRIGLRSVETYRYRLMKKLGVTNAAALVQYAMTHGLVPTSDA